MEIEYAVQEKPNGLAQAFVIGRDFIGDDDVCLVLGDNIFFGHDLGSLLDKRDIYENKATVFGYYVSDPSRYGVVEFDDDGHVVSIEEKPKKPKSNYAVVGLYFYPNDVVEMVSRLKPSKRGEYEITDLNREYLKQNRLDVRLMGRGFAWLDTGTHNSLSDATNFVRTLVDRTGLQIGCVEEIAYDKGWISSGQLKKLAENYGNSSYGAYLRTILSKCICTTTEV